MHKFILVYTYFICSIRNILSIIPFSIDVANSTLFFSNFLHTRYANFVHVLSLSLLKKPKCTVVTHRWNEINIVLISIQWIWIPIQFRLTHASWYLFNSACFSLIHFQYMWTLVSLNHTDLIILLLQDKSITYSMNARNVNYFNK